MKSALSLRSAHLVRGSLARKLGQRFVVRWRRRQGLLVLLRRVGLLLRLRRGKLLWRAAAAESCFERAELLRHQLELARERAQLRLHRIDSRGETGGIVDALARSCARTFLR